MGYGTYHLSVNTENSVQWKSVQCFLGEPDLSSQFAQTSWKEKTNVLIKYQIHNYQSIIHFWHFPVFCVLVYAYRCNRVRPLNIRFININHQFSFTLVFLFFVVYMFITYCIQKGSKNGGGGVEILYSEYLINALVSLSYYRTFYWPLPLCPH